jgi:hypothetical protein
MRHACAQIDDDALERGGKLLLPPSALELLSEESGASSFDAHMAYLPRSAFGAGMVCAHCIVIARARASLTLACVRPR